MAYIGKQPLVGNFVKLDAITTSATTTFNLLNGGVAYFPQTANNCLVSLNGILQAPTDSYTISGSTIVFSSALTTSDVIDFIIVLGDVLNIGTPSDNTVSTAKLASGLVVPYGKGGTGLTTLGTANQVLAVNSGATALEFQSVSSDYVLLASTEASSSASVSFDGYFSSTYKNYKLIGSIVIPATNSVNAQIRFRRSNADVTASNYKWGWSGFNLNSTPDTSSYVDGNYNTSYIQVATSSISSTTSYGGVTFEATLFNPLNTSSWKTIMFNTSQYNTNNNNYYAMFQSGMLQDSTAALSGITFYFTSGNIASGNFKLYGIK